MGRPRLPRGQAREMILRARVKPFAGQRFKAVATRRGLTESAALREAVADWLGRHDR